MKAYGIWLDSIMRKGWYLQTGKAPLGQALKRHLNWRKNKQMYCLWDD